MTKTEYQNIERALQEILERVKSDKNYSKEMLKKTGIYNEDGTISENYNRKMPSSVCIK